VFATDRATARELLACAPTPGAIAALIARTPVALAPPPYLAFTMAAPDPRALRRAERRLVWSLRKSADGIAATWINRRNLAARVVGSSRGRRSIRITSRCSR